MRDGELFCRARKEFSALFLPLFGTFLTDWLLGNGISQVLLYFLNFPLRGLQETNPDEVAVILLLAGVPLLFVVGIFSSLLNLGAFRLCLARGEGKPGTMPWTILSQWRRYMGWALWMGIFPIVWREGKRLGIIFLAHIMDDVSFVRFNLSMNYWNGVLFLLSLVLFMPLALFIKTAYLRSPERGFWRAVSFGLKEGFRKWPKTIGAHLKFVVPMNLMVLFMTVLLSKLAFSIGGSGISRLCSLASSLFSMVASVWVTVLSGILAADRYDPPEPGKGKKGVDKEGAGCSI